MTEKTVPLSLRLAFREEHGMWNAYMAQLGTMDGAILIGSVVMSGVTNSLQRKNSFMAMMKGIMADHVKAVTGQPSRWGGEHAAPEHERMVKKPEGLS